MKLVAKETGIFSCPFSDIKNQLLPSPVPGTWYRVPGN